MNRKAGAWSVQSVAGHECEIFEPARPHAEGLVAIYLHGVHQQSLADKPVFNSLFEQHGLRIVAPRTGESWWTDRICAEFDPVVTCERYLLDCVLPFIAETFDASPPTIGLFGTSMGGQGALRFGFKHPRLFPVVVGISPAIDYQRRISEGDPVLAAMYRDAEQARQDTATLHVHPFSWPRHTWFCCDPLDARWWESADRLQMKLSAVGVPHACDLKTSGGGHSFEYYERMAPSAVGFLVERLEQEQRRVP